MASGPDNMNGRRPDEADLLAWVEGKKLSPELDAAVARLLVNDPKLARELELMREDRLAMRLLRDEAAPAGLMDSVEAALQPVLERQLLLGLQQGEPTESRPVVSMVRSEKRGIFQTFLADRAGRRMAMAASLLLLVGAGTLVGTIVLSRGTQPTPIPVTLRDGLATGESKVIEKPLAIAIAPSTVTTETNNAARKSVDVPVVPPPAGPGESGTALAADTASDGPLVGPVKVPVDPALAAELARDHKLVIRVLSSAAAKTPSAIADRIKKETSSPAWKLANEVSSELAAALKPEGDVPFDDARPVRIEPPSFAGDDETIARALEGTMGPPAPAQFGAPMEVASAGPSVYLFQARLDATTLAQLKSSLQKAGRAEDVVFEEQREALPLDARSPILVPNAVLWWENGPAGWTNWGEVPVVVNPNR